MYETTGCQPHWSMTTVEILRGVSLVHHIEADGTAWGSTGRTILRRETNGQWVRTAQFPFIPPRDFFGLSRLSARVSRADKCNVFVNSNGYTLAIRAGSVYVIGEDNSLERRFGIQGDCVLHGGICEDTAGWTYFGEYFQNIQRGPVRIWRMSPKLDRHEVAYEFPAGRIRHIHGVFRDPFDEQTLWATVGDYANECYLVRTHDRYTTAEWFGDGTQIWRAVTLFFTPDHVCWLTDSHLDQNYACRMDRRSGELEKGQRVACSGWYGLTTTDGLYVGFTTVERGPGIQSNLSSILVSNDGFHWTEAGSFRKDGWRPMRLFKNGVISCPTGQMFTKDIYISGEGLVGFDGSSRRIRIDPSGDPS